MQKHFVQCSSLLLFMRETKAPQCDQGRSFESCIILGYTCNAAVPGFLSADREFAFELMDMHQD